MKGKLQKLLMILIALGLGGMASLVQSGLVARSAPDQVNDFSASPEAVFVPGEILIKLKPAAREKVKVHSNSRGIKGTNIPSLDRLNNKFGVTRFERVIKNDKKDHREDHPLSNYYSLTIAPDIDVLQAISQYQNDPNLEAAEPVYILRTAGFPNDPNFNQQWGLDNTGQSGGTPDRDIDAPEAWDITVGDPEIVIAIIDTGVDWNHPDLATNIWRNPGEIPENGIDDEGNGFVDDIRGWDFITSTSVYPGEDGGPEDNDPMDFFGHGTHVAGISAAVSDNGIGGAGVCPKCSVMPVRAGFKDQSGAGVLIDIDIAKAIIYAADNGARVINMSFGSGFGSSLLKDAIQYAADRGVLLIAAAGNIGFDTYFVPAAYDEVMAIAATDHNDQRSWWDDPWASNFGYWVDVAAPGSQIFSTVFDDSYDSWNGTSMATPHVAGLAGLILSQRSSLTASEVWKIIISTTDSISADEYIGSGRINAYAALQMSAAPAAEITSPATNEFLTGAIEVKGTASAEDFKSYRLEYGLGDYPVTWTKFVESSKPVDGGILGEWDTHSLENGPYFLKLSVSDNQGNTSIALTRVIVDINMHPGWPKQYVGNPPTIADVDGDSAQDVILTSINGDASVYIWNGDGSLLPGWPQKVGYQARGSAAVADLDGDGSQEVIAASANGGYPVDQVFVWRSDGSPFPGWPISLGSKALNSPAIVDIDRDGRKEIIVSTFADYGSSSEIVVYIWNQEGSVLPGWPQRFSSPPNFLPPWSSTPAVGDIDGDGFAEILVGINNGWVYTWNHDGSELQGWPKEVSPGTSSSRLASIILGDVNGDGRLEVVGSSRSFEVHLWRGDGTEMPGWPQVIPNYAVGEAALGDLDEDGDLEIIVAANNSQTYAWDHTGRPVTGWPIQLDTWSQPVIADVDGDQLPDIVAGSNGKKVYAYHGDGSIVAGWPKYILNPSTITPAVGDTDGDGQLELVLADEYLIYMWDLPSPAGAGQVEWGMYQHDARNTGQHGVEDPTNSTRQVQIDIRPGQASNVISYKSQGLISVAILSSPDFDASSLVNHRTLTFGRTGNETSLYQKGSGDQRACRSRDVDGNGLPDLVCQFEISKTGFQCGDKVGILKGLTKDLAAIDGQDSVVPLPCK